MPTNAFFADAPGVYTSHKNILNLNTINTRKWHSESADPAKALDLSLAKQTNKQTNKNFWTHRGLNSRPSRF